MKTLAASACLLLFVGGPALADPAPPARPDSLKIHFAQRDAQALRAFDVIVSPARPCATASEKNPDQQIELKACLSDDAHLDVEWFTRTAAGEYRSTSSLPVTRGQTTEIGTSSGPRLGVTVQ
jgi:hypothetical protein